MPISMRAGTCSPDSGSRRTSRPSRVTRSNQSGPDAGSAFGEAADADGSFEIVGHLGELARQRRQLAVEVAQKAARQLHYPRIGDIGRIHDQQVRAGERVVAGLEYFAQLAEETVHVRLEKARLV